jgi:NTP pyrophosphatase (non-canonical NTP hydrolase)
LNIRIDELLNMCSKWSEVRGILKHSNPQVQGLKLVSEVGELSDNLAKGRDVKDDIGDCLVVLNNIALMHDTTLAECLQVAYDDIKDRKGKMQPNGVFIKELDV